MPLSQRTIDEMKAGMAQAAAHGGGAVTAEYMDAMIRTGMRAKWLRDREKEGKLKIVKVQRGNTSAKKEGDNWVYEVHMGKGPTLQVFLDDNACLMGAWPTEILMANVALALGAGIGQEEV